MKLLLTQYKRIVKKNIVTINMILTSMIVRSRFIDTSVMASITCPNSQDPIKFAGKHITVNKNERTNSA